MLEVVIPGTRYGEGVMGSATAYCGTFCYMAGVDSSGRIILQLPGTVANAMKARWVVNKYYYSDDYSDTSNAVDKIADGDTCIYYGDGEFITNKVQWGHKITSAMWATLETVSTIDSRRPYVPGSDTALASIGLVKCFVTTSVSSKKGWLNFTSSGGCVFGQPGRQSTALSSIGWLTGVYFKDSANAWARFRLDPRGSSLSWR